MENMLVGAGIVFMAGALIGGGLSAFGVTLPLFSSIKRQIMLFLLGAALLAAGAYSSRNPPKVDPGKGPAESTTPNRPGEGRQGTETNIVTPPPRPEPEPDPDPTMGPLEEGVNRQGHDFNNIGVTTANAQDCAELCRTNHDCVAMTYVISLRRCWMKKEVPAPKPDPDMISALKDKS